MMNTLSLSARAKSDSLKKPKEVYSYSRDEQGKWDLDEAKSKTEVLSHFYFPDSYLNQPIDLSAGFNKFKKIPEAENVANFPSLLASIMQHEQKSGKRIKTDIVTFRGIMTKLLSLPQEAENNVDLFAIAYDGQIFIKNDDALSLKNKESQSSLIAPGSDKEKHIKICEYTGYKFEQLTTIPKPWAHCSRNSIEKRNKATVSNYKQYISVVKSGIGNVKTLVAGEVDCVFDYLPEKDVLSHYAELKTSLALESSANMKTFEHKLHRTWAQCFLLGVTKIIYGYRDRQYMLRNIEVFDTEEVPVMLQNQNSSEKINCLDSLRWYGAVLEWITQSIDRQDESKAYKITYDPASRKLSIRACDAATNKELREGGILTEEFCAWRNTLRAK